MTSFTVVFGFGGSSNTVWQRCLPVASREEANKQREAIVLAGRPAYVHQTDMLDAIGMPEGAAPAWDYEKLRWR